MREGNLRTGQSYCRDPLRPTASFTVLLKNVLLLSAYVGRCRRCLVSEDM